MAFSPALGCSVTWNAAVVVGVQKIEGPGGKTNKVDTTHLGTTGGIETFLLTTVNPGQYRCTCLFDPDDVVHKAILTDWKAKAFHAVIITRSDPSPSTITAASAAITDYNESKDVKGVLMFDFTIEINGDFIVA
jgi:hypothetical protein